MEESKRGGSSDSPRKDERVTLASRGGAEETADTEIEREREGVRSLGRRQSCPNETEGMQVEEDGWKVGRVRDKTVSR